MLLERERCRYREREWGLGFDQILWMCCLLSFYFFVCFDSLTHETVSLSLSLSNSRHREKPRERKIWIERERECNIEVERRFRQTKKIYMENPKSKKRGKISVISAELDTLAVKPLSLSL